MNIITIDFETYYSKTYGFSKLNTEEYVRGDEWETIGVAVKENDDETRWCTGTHAELARFL